MGLHDAPFRESDPLDEKPGRLRIAEHLCEPQAGDTGFSSHVICSGVSITPVWVASAALDPRGNSSAALKIGIQPVLFMAFSKNRLRESRRHPCADGTAQR
jgi:hypothetical protein